MIVYIDSNILIYMTQPQSKFFEPAAELLINSSRGDYLLATSSFGLAECLALSPDNVLSFDFERLLSRHSIQEIPFGHESALEFAQIRVENGKSLRAPDIIHLACAKIGRADCFVTNDQALCKAKVQGLKIVPLTSFVSG